MNLIREDDEALLIELHARGSELEERYRELLDGEGVPARMREALAAVVDARSAVLEAVADRLRDRDSLPRAGDPDRAYFGALGDVLGAELGILIDRLVQAESSWYETIEESRQLDWAPDDRSAVDAVARHIETSIDRFEGARGGD
jgi:hypothetical protein